MHAAQFGRQPRKPPAPARGFKQVRVLRAHMSVSSPCEICQRAAVEHTCDRCGQLVCEDHFDAELGFCVECGADVSGGTPGREPEPEHMPDGVDTYRF